MLNASLSHSSFVIHPLAVSSAGLLVMQLKALEIKNFLASRKERFLRLVLHWEGGGEIDLRYETSAMLIT